MNRPGHADDPSATPLPQLSAAAPGPKKRERNTAIDLVRGLVMVLMVLDHSRDFFFGNVPDPTDLQATTLPLFVTRWVTHFCAPGFVFLAGTAAYLAGHRRTSNQLSWFLLSRGAWLVVLELTVVRFGWIPDPTYQFILLQVIWAIGWSMIILALLARMPSRVVAGIGVAIIALHNLADGVQASSFGDLGWLWTVLLAGKSVMGTAPGPMIWSEYSIVPWAGVMAAGFGFAELVTWPVARFRKVVWRLGLALCGLFFLLRGLNLYGDPHPWSLQSSVVFSVLSFINCEKYPPSLLFLLMTMGPLLMALALFTRVNTHHGFAKAILIFGRVPLFFYVVHLYLLRYPSFIAAGLVWGFDRLGPPPLHTSPEWPLWTTWAIWATAVVVLFWPARWFANVKRRRRDWWLSYI